jgi:type I restriction enzyme R subunit
MTNFAFLAIDWPDVADSARRAEAAIHADPRAACFYARRTLELVMTWVFKTDVSLRMPYADNLSALIHEPTFKAAAGEAVFSKARLITQLGNHAVHSQRSIPTADALTAVGELFHVGYWLARTYARGPKPPPTLAFDPAKVPPAPSAIVPKQTVEQLQKLETSLREKDEKLAALQADKSNLDEELKQLRAEVAAAKKASAAQPDTHDYSEADTRKHLIDLLLHEAGWALADARDREYPLKGMPSHSGDGYADYVLWGDDGKALAVVEAKRSTKSAQLGRQQAKLYADCLEKESGQRPVIFGTNGYEHWVWDDTRYPPRPVQGFYKKAELELLVQRRATRKALAGAPINQDIVERPYQHHSIRSIGEAFERDNERKALIVMATGAGKTRTVIALCAQLMECNWAKRVLFLADRRALVKQAAGAFLKHLPDSSPVNLLETKDGEGRVFVSTYPTMMSLIDEMQGGQRRFGVGHFDLIVIDEAHRSVYQKYGAIFRYFDALLVGLTATPKSEVDANTYKIFDLESGVPTDAYDLDEAVKDGFLVPAKAVSVPRKFQRQGISYDDLSEEEKERWDDIEWSDEDESPDRVEAEAVNKWLFNIDTVDKALEHLMTRGQTVAGGDRLGKTIIFAKNQKHAEFIVDRFDVNYPTHKGVFARVIHSEVPYVDTLIEDFSVANKAPHIAVSVDMLDTGIDVPEVVNLVFFKLVRSKTKFWQMVGRGTRLCKNLFGPDRHKTFFYIFDFCQNLEFFRQNPATTDGALGQSLGTRLFRSRLELIGELDRAAEPAGLAEAAPPPYGGIVTEGAVTTTAQLRQSLTSRLHGEVASMNLNNFVVRPKRQLVERYAKPEAWLTLGADALGEISRELSQLPNGLESEDEEAKRFDLVMLNLQLAVLRVEPAYKRLSQQVRSIAGRLEEKSAIPMVKDQLALLQDLQSDAWWEDVTLPMLENVRRRLRSLVKLIDKAERKIVYTDFEDEIGDGAEVELDAFVAGDGFERFRLKARTYLREHEDHLTIRKLRMNRALTATDLAELERMLHASGVGDAGSLERAKVESEGLGLFVRSLVGLDREAAKEAFAGFLAGKTMTANQIKFVNLIVNHLTEHGMMDPSLLYDSPFTDIAPQGPDEVFSSAQVDELLTILDRVREAALAA